MTGLETGTAEGAATQPATAGGERAKPTVKVSVIVPVYNPGPYLEDCIGSLLRQSLPDDEYEAIFVDDGSTDESPARLDALAAEHPHMRVIHQENSGWSGKPRNVGIEAARGEYVFFSDNDDWLGDEALERMYAFARKNDSDVVIGKMAGKGRGVPRELFRRNYDKATLDTAPLIDSLTPHKLFRTAFLDKHALRFPEGRRRLEDHVFVTAAYFAADTISVLSDYVCYFHVRRDDHSNAAFGRIDPAGYFANLTEALDIVRDNTAPGPLRDRLYRRWYRIEMIGRLRGRKLLARPAGESREILDQVRRIAGERFGPGVSDRLPPSQRAIGSLARAGLMNDLLRLAEWEEDLGATARLDDLRWHSGALQLEVSAELRVGGEPVTFAQEDGRDLLHLPSLTGEGRKAVSDADLDATARLRLSKVDVLVRSRESAAEHYLPITFTASRQPVDGGGTFRQVLHGEATLDVSTAAGGAPLADGIWDVLVRVTSCGWASPVRLGSVRSSGASDQRQSAALGDPVRAVTPYWTDQGNLSLDLGQRTSRLSRDLLTPTPEPARVQRAGGGAGLSLSIPLRLLALRPGTGGSVRLVHEVSGEEVRAPAELVPERTEDTSYSVLHAQLDGNLASGQWSVEIRPLPTGAFVRLPRVVEVAADGTPTLKEHTRRVEVDASDEPPEQPTGSPQRSALGRVGRRIARRVVRKVRARLATSRTR